MSPTKIFRNPVGMAFGLLAARGALGLYFAIAGFGKIYNRGYAAWMEGYRETQPPWLPDIIGIPFGYALPVLELVFGGLLLIGFLGRLSAGAVTFMLASIIVGANTFTDGSKPFHANLIYLALAILLLFTGPGLFSVDRVLGGARLPHEPDVPVASEAQTP